MNRAAAIHLLTELGPVLIFYIVGQFYDFYTSVSALLLATVSALIFSWLYERSLPFLAIISTLFVVTSGLITVVYKAPDAVIFSDSLYYFMISGVIGYGLLHGKLFLKWLFERTFAMEDRGWKILSQRWCFAFLIGGLGNEFVRIFLTPEIWVDYKLVKVLLILLFGMYQFTLSRRYRLPEESNEWGLRTKKIPAAVFSTVLPGLPK